MIIQTGMRTDIPAFYHEWLLNRINDCAGCMTVSTFETALHSHLDVPKRKTNQRNGQCACLLGGSMPGDVIHDAVQKSWIDGQMRFDFE
ncbi:MAG: DUF1848 domain-containing protein [Lachnospiraceae bacterium]|nr:DUF1848 domain-containing protein [Lachnospiraceae bacterium]